MVEEGQVCITVCMVVIYDALAGKHLKELIEFRSWCVGNPLCVDEFCLFFFLFLGVKGHSRSSEVKL